MSAPAGPNSLDSRTFSSAKQSTIASSSEISSPTHLIYNHQNYKPDQELSTKVRKANHLIGNYISQIIFRFTAVIFTKFSYMTVLYLKFRFVELVSE